MGLISGLAFGGKILITWYLWGLDGYGESVNDWADDESFTWTEIEWFEPGFKKILWKKSSVKSKTEKRGLELLGTDCGLHYKLCEEDYDDRFASLRRFGSGSYYERAKVREPNEFDLMLIFQDLTATSMVSFTRGPGMTVQTPLGRWWVAIHNNIDVAVRSKELELALRACSPVWGISRVRRVDGRAASASRREE